MWKVQHNEGAREINELHVPVNRDIRLTLTSEDVIHDRFSVLKSFRTKTDVLPGRYTTEWFRPTKVGEYHIFCMEYCGTKHSGMIGTVYVMNESDYNTWLGLAKAAARARWRNRERVCSTNWAGGTCHPSAMNKQNGAVPESERFVRHDGAVERRIPRLERMSRISANRCSYPQSQDRRRL